MPDSYPRYLTTKELATLLRIKERKVYELVANNEVPCSRATGKLLFPADAIESWLVKKGSGFSIQDNSRPMVFLGSHEPLLEWAIRQSGCGLATYCDGSEDGLKRFASGEGVISGLHLFDQQEAKWNVPAVEQYCGECDSVLIEFAFRERGLLVAKGNPLGITGLESLSSARVAMRQSGAGAQVLFLHELEIRGIDVDVITTTTIARTETEAATAVTSAEADAAFGLRSVAQQLQLDFVAVTSERYDLLIDRKAWFEPACQTLFAFLRSEECQKRIKNTVGYDISGFETVHYNAA